MVWCLNGCLLKKPRKRDELYLSALLGVPEKVPMATDVCGATVNVTLQWTKEIVRHSRAGDLGFAGYCIGLGDQSLGDEGCGKDRTESRPRRAWRPFETALI